MARMIAVVGKSGEGKSTSYGEIPELDIKGLPPKQTFIVNILGKDLPFKGWRTKYKNWIGDDGAPTPTGNYYASRDAAKIAAGIGFISENRPEVKHLLIDDFQYLMGLEYMDRANQDGFKKFQQIANSAWTVISAAQQARPDLNVIFLTHTEENETTYGTTFKIKTVGNAVDKYITMEGLFTVLLYTRQYFDKKDKKVVKEFVTNFDGKLPAKSPIGMFPELYIKNDLGLVVDAIELYNG